MMDNNEIAEMMDLLKDTLAIVAGNVYAAQSDDGKISFQEALALTTSTAVHAMRVVTAFQGLSKSSVKELIDTLANSDLIFQER